MPETSPALASTARQAVSSDAAGPDHGGRGGAPAPEREALAGLVERVTFHNPENGFCVLRVKVRGQRELATVVGAAAAITAGEFVQASGTWVNDRAHGLQFKAAFLRAAPPTTLEGIEKYLGSGMVKGIGPVYAGRLVAAFGEAVFDVIEAEPARLREVAGIGPKRAGRIVKGWAEQKVVREIMLFLHGHGVGTSRAVRIFKTYGADAVQVITENPYRLARDIRGIGFKSADQVAARLGIEKTAMIRARAGISFALAEAMDEGHCGLPVDELRALAAGLLEIPPEVVDEALALELAEGAVVADTVAGRGCVFLAGLHRAERGIAERLRRLADGTPPWPAVDPGKAIPWVEAKAGVTLAASQREAVRLALRSKLLVVTGGPGVGKTTLVNSVLKILASKTPAIALAAPTGRAAKRLGEATGREARTLHRLLEADPAGGGFKRGEDHPLECDLLVVDEVSMVDVPLMHALLKAVPPPAALLLVGDVDQLPSVGPGQVLADVIASGAVPVARLTEVFRQAAQSRIVTNAHRINRGEMPEPGDDPASDFHLVRCKDAEDGAAKLLEVVARRIPARFGLDPVKDVQVLCPMNRGGLGARSLNLELQRLLNPPGEVRVERFGWSFGPGDKVMQVENDYDKDVFNGDLGLVEAVDADEGELVVDFDGREVRYGFGELDALVLAYATTVHKAQGSEYPAVVMPVTTQHWPMLRRNLLYTGVTRGKRLVVLVAQPKAVAMAVKGREGRRRWSKLRELLPCAAG
jgi:exodeoxyribonuclease V alpha subunit